jgi:hypothetical protein
MGWKIAFGHAKVYRTYDNFAGSDVFRSSVAASRLT